MAQDADTLPDLTPSQLHSLQIFAALHGRCWKQHLRAAWMNARGVTPDLHHLRNTHGPSWLDGFRLPNRKAIQ